MGTINLTKTLAALAVGGALLSSAIQSQAGMATLTYGAPGFSGTGPNNGTWLTAQLKDVLGGTTVELKFDNSIANGVHLKWIGFNVPTYATTISGIGVTGGGINPSWVTLSTSLNDTGPGNALKADGDGFYDVVVTKNSGFFSQTGGNTLTFTITGATVADLTSANSYSWGGAKGAFRSAVHIGGYQDSVWGSATLTGDGVVPEPSTIVAGALLLLPFGISTIRRFRRS